MSEPFTSPHSEEPSPPGPPSPVSAPPAGRSARVRLLVVAGVSMLVGALVATGVVLYLTSEEHKYTIRLVLARDISEEQKAAVESTLGSLQTGGDVEFTTKEQAWTEYQEMFEDKPELLEQQGPENMAEAFSVTTEDAAFACAQLDALHEVSGVEGAQVLQEPDDELPFAAVSCG